MKIKASFSATGDSLIVKRLPQGYKGLNPLSTFIRKADAKLSNLETVLSDFNCFPSTYSGGTWVNASPDVLKDLKSFGFNMFGCANNHSMDYSYDGLLSTINAIKNSEVEFAGIGHNLYEASSPAILDLPSARVGVISICSTFNDAARAGDQTEYLPGRPGLNPLRHKTIYHISSDHLETLREIDKSCYINGTRSNLIKSGFLPKDSEGVFVLDSITFMESDTEYKETVPNEIDMERTKKTITDALKYVDYVVVMAHSHEIKAESHQEPDYFFEKFCHSCIDAGACAVIGGGTHQLKPIEIYKNRPIFYSLGNFIFQNNLVKVLPLDFREKYKIPKDYTTAEALAVRSKNDTIGLMTEYENFLSVIPYFEMEGDKLTKVTLKPIELGFDLPRTFKGLPYEADEKATSDILKTLTEISQKYNTQMIEKNGMIEVLL